MKNGLSLDLSKVQPYASLAELDKMEGMVNFAHNTVHEGTGAGSDFLGWLDLPVNYDKEEFARIKVAANKIKENSYWDWWIIFRSKSCYRRVNK